MIIGKTPDGQRVLKDRSVSLTPRQRAAFILVDGKRTVQEVLAATAGGGVTQADIDRLMELGLIAEVPAVPTGLAYLQANSAKLEAKRTERTPEERYAEAYPIASMLVSNLGLRGYRLNLAVESCMTYLDLLALAPRIREAVGDDSYSMLERALYE